MAFGRRRARWAGIRSAHPQLFDGLAPTISLSEMPPSDRPELRLALGPLASAGAAAKLCTTLERFRLTRLSEKIDHRQRRRTTTSVHLKNL